MTDEHQPLGGAAVFLRHAERVDHGRTVEPVLEYEAGVPTAGESCELGGRSCSSSGRRDDDIGDQPEVPKRNTHTFR